MRRLASVPVTVAAAALAGVSAYLLGLLAAAASARARTPVATPPLPSFVVLVPAHDEEQQIGRTVAALAGLAYAGGWETVVVADNCADRTAEAAGAAGATVWERRDDQRGKGAALAWAFGRVRSERPDVKAVAVVDADCIPSPNLLEAFASRLGAGAAAVQSDYVVSNPADSPASAIRFAAFALMNTVRPRGKDALGLSCGLLGTGMAFTTDLLERVPWDAFGITEDGEYHVRLVAAGERVVFAREASVSSPMPTSFGASEVQQTRWEGGRFALALRHAPALMGSALCRRDTARANAALELAIPPQAMLLGLNGATWACAAVLGIRPAARLAAAALAGQLSFVLGGLALVRAPARVYAALLLAPRLVARKLALMTRVITGRASSAWIRTPR